MYLEHRLQVVSYCLAPKLRCAKEIELIIFMLFICAITYSVSFVHKIFCDYLLLADLRYWSNLENVLGTISLGGIPLQELNLAGNADANGKIIARVSRLFGETLVSLILAACPNIDKVSIAFISGLTKLQALDVSEIPFLTDDHIERFVSKDLPNLHTLNISGCSKMTDAALHCISRTNHRFLSLHAARNFNYTQAGVNALLLHCESLTCLDMSYCPGLRDIGVVIHVGSSPKKGNTNPFPGPEDGGYLQYAGRSLKVLRLDECSHLSEVSLDYCAGALAALTHVYLPRIPNLTDALVQGLACGAHHLKVLHVQGCKGVRGTALESLGANAKCLVELNIANIGPFSHKSLRMLLTTNETLSFINVANNKGVTDAVFSEMEIPNSGGMAVFLPHVKRITLSGTSVTGYGVACLAERCANLEHLDVSNHPFINDAALTVVAGCCRNLRSLWLNDCPAITDKGIISICYACKLLEVLHLSDSRRVLDAWGTRVIQYSDAIIEACLDGLRCLKELSLRNQCGVFLASPWLLTELHQRGGHQFLEKIDLRGADKVNLKSAAVVFSECSELCYVILSPESDLPGVTAESFWTSAFSNCMYTQAYVNPTASNAENTSITETSAASSRSLQTSASLPGSKPQIAPLPPGVENGRYSGDDGVGSYVSEVFSKALEEWATQKASSAAAGSPEAKANNGMLQGSVASISTLGHGSLRTSLDKEGSSMVDFSVTKRKGFGDNGSISSEGSHKSQRSRSLSPAKLIDSILKVQGLNDNSKAVVSTSKALEGKAGVPPSKPAGYLALAGHPLRKAYRYRDMYIRRRLVEQDCARFIQLKWKLYAFWQRFRRRLSARKIANTYKVILERRKLAIAVHALAIQNSAKRIQRYFRNSKLPLVKAATKIQKIYRGHRCKHLLYRKAHEEWASVKIQKIVRGMLVRISDRYILAQIYLKLPPFWRTIMKSLPPYAAGVALAPGDKPLTPEEAAKYAAEEAVRKRIFPYQIAEAREDVQHMLKHIIEDVVTDGILKPKLPLLVAQPFDKKPYISNQYGRHIDYYSHIDGLLASDTAATTGRAKEKREKAQRRLKYDANGMDMFKAAERARKNGSTVENMSLLLALQVRIFRKVISFKCCFTFRFLFSHYS